MDDANLRSLIDKIQGLPADAQLLLVAEAFRLLLEAAQIGRSDHLSLHDAGKAVERMRAAIARGVAPQPPIVPKRADLLIDLLRQNEPVAKPAAAPLVRAAGLILRAAADETEEPILLAVGELATAADALGPEVRTAFDRIFQSSEASTAEPPRFVRAAVPHDPIRQALRPEEDPAGATGDQDVARPGEFVLFLDPGDATVDDVRAVLAALNRLHIAAGGLGLVFKVEGESIRAVEGILA